MKQFLLLGLLFTVSHSAFSQTEPNMEIKNKSAKIWIRVKNAGSFLTETKRAPKGIFVVEAGTEKKSVDLKLSNLDLSKETRLYIYANADTSKPLREYYFAKNKTIYVTWNGELLYPQTGKWVGLTGKTDSGYSLANNVIVDPKKSVDINRVETADPEITASNIIKNASTKLDKAISLNKLWKQWCDSSEIKPERPDSLFCAAGYGNEFALLILRLRFIVPTDADNKLDPSQHLFKMIADNLPKAEKEGDLDQQALFRGFFPKIERNEALTWKDFNAFIKPVKSNPTLAKFIGGVLSDYGLSTVENRTEKVLKDRASDLKLKAQAELNDKSLQFPVSGILDSANQRMDLDQIYKSKCKGDTPSWNGTLFCAMGDGNASAQFFGQVRFVKPKKKEQHAISMILTATKTWTDSKSEGYLDGLAKGVAKKAITWQLGEAIKVIENDEASLTWEDLRNVLVYRGYTSYTTINLINKVLYFANPSIKAKGLEIAP